jgi:hypothetical protein
MWSYYEVTFLEKGEFMLEICYFYVQKLFVEQVFHHVPWDSFVRSQCLWTCHLSQIGTGVTNASIKARKAVDKDLEDEIEDIPVVSTSVAYGVYMAISSNLR